LGFVNRPAGPGHGVRVATLRKEHRRQLEADTLSQGVKTIGEIVAEIGHDRPQRELDENPRAEFDILGDDADAPIRRRIDSGPLRWADITTTGRGVELGKKGEVLQCPYCY